MKKLIKGAKKLGLPLNRDQVRQFEVYFREMLDWNQRVNLTAITEYEEVQIKHFLDSLTIFSVLDNSGSNKDLNMLDVGTGAGLPGIPLKIAIPEIKLILVEATGKKTEFLNYFPSFPNFKQYN